MKRGEIWNVDMGLPPGGSGREQAGFRPALIISDDPEDTSNPLCMVIPCTSKTAAQRFPHTLLVEPSSRNGLTSPSVFLVFQLRAIDKKRFQDRRGELESESLVAIEQIIREMLAL